jgi:RES domain-containing protein
VPALYTCFHPLTAIREVSRLGAPLQPITICEYRVDCHRIFDAADPMRCAENGITQAMLACPTWREQMLAGAVPASQALADRLIGLGYCGMIVRSFAARTSERDLNVVFWRWSEEPPTMVRVVDDEGRLGPPAG